MKKHNNKRKIAFIILYALIAFSLYITYLKFFSIENNNIIEIPVNESSSNAIHIALNNITNNFNKSTKVKKYSAENSVALQATVNNYYLYISYIDNMTTTYEFSYDNLCLNITVNEEKSNEEEFKMILRFLIEAVQKRLNNTSDIDIYVDNFFDNDINYDGLIKVKTENGIKYQINITKKIKSN